MAAGCRTVTCTNHAKACGSNLNCRQPGKIKLMCKKHISAMALYADPGTAAESSDLVRSASVHVEGETGQHL